MTSKAAHSVWSARKAPAVPQLTGRVPAKDGTQMVYLKHMHARTLGPVPCCPAARQFVTPAGSNTRTHSHMAPLLSRRSPVSWLWDACLQCTHTERSECISTACGCRQSQPCRLQRRPTRAARTGCAHSSKRAGKALGLPQVSGSGPAMWERNARASSGPGSRKIARNKQQGAEVPSSPWLGMWERGLVLAASSHPKRHCNLCTCMERGTSSTELDCAPQDDPR